MSNYLDIKLDYASDKDYLRLLELLKIMVNRKEPIVIHIKSELEKFFNDLGLACAEEVQMGHLLEKHMTAEQDTLLYAFLGKMILDTYITETYFIKSESDKVVYEIKGVKDESKTTKGKRKSTNKSKPN